SRNLEVYANFRVTKAHGRQHHRAYSSFQDVEPPASKRSRLPRHHHLPHYHNPWCRETRLLLSEIVQPCFNPCLLFILPVLALESARNFSICHPETNCLLAVASES